MITAENAEFAEFRLLRGYFLSDLRDLCG